MTIRKARQHKPSTGENRPADEPRLLLYAGFIRLHILHHACEEPIFGLGIIRELQRHGYNLSAGTLYPILHTLEERGYLRSSEQTVGRSRRRVYRATPLGKRALAEGKLKLRELAGELLEANVDDTA